MPGHSEVLQILEQAMINEIDGYDFYNAAAERVSDENGSSMLRSLAGDEMTHLQILQAEYAKVNAGGAFLSIEDVRRQLPPMPDLQLFPDKRELPKMLAAATDDEAALKVALEFERKGYALYAGAVEKTDDLNAQAVFRYLADWENQHYELLDNSLHYLQDNGMWYFQDLEHPFFEG